MIAFMLKALLLLLGHAASAAVMVVVFEFHLLVACTVLAVAMLVFWISAPEQLESDTAQESLPPPDPVTTSLAGLL